MSAIPPTRPATVELGGGCPGRLTCTFVACLSSWRTTLSLTFVSRKWLMFSRPLCARSSPRHFQQDLAATEEMLHRVLDMFEGVHARHGDNKGTVGHQRCRLTNDRHHLVAVVEVADKESADGEVLADQCRGVDPHGFVPGPGIADQPSTVGPQFEQPRHPRTTPGGHSQPPSPVA